MRKESKVLEYQEKVTSTFLKTVSAYANYGTGEIVFGISDSGRIIGVSNIEKTCIDIENRINDNLDPVPEYTLEVDDHTLVITLRVSEGFNKPYFYKSKAYRRNDTSTVAVDSFELKRLILEGQNRGFEELPSSDQNLTFSILETKLKEKLNIETFSLDTLKTLELYQEGTGYNIAAQLLADTNACFGIDIARFGDSINIILDRETFEHISILDQYDKAVNMFQKYYQYDQIKGIQRETISLIPEEAFREAVANALVHRTWDTHAHITIGMFPEKIVITSLGGLPGDIRLEQYLNGGISVLRNRIIGNVFFRLNLIERFGTGIRRIREVYKNSRVKPIFEVSDTSIQVTLPLYQTQRNLTDDEETVYSKVLGRKVSSSKIAEESGFGKTKTVSILNKLVQKGYLQTEGTGRGTKYKID